MNFCGHKFESYNVSYYFTPMIIYDHTVSISRSSAAITLAIHNYKALYTLFPVKRIYRCCISLYQDIKMIVTCKLVIMKNKNVAMLSDRFITLKALI